MLSFPDRERNPSTLPRRRLQRLVNTPEAHSISDSTSQTSACPASASQTRSDRVGLLLINLGTPDAPHPPEVRRYLREFLSDPRVLDINPVLRKILLECVILPTRPKESSEAYETIWTDRGSPLLFHGVDLAKKVSERVGAHVSVELAMRYQNPSIASKLDRMIESGIDRIVAFPLFPQYSSAAWGSAVEKLFVEANKRWDVPSIQVVPPYYDHPGFIDAFRRVAEPILADLNPDRVVLSYHGVPERHVKKSDATGGVDGKHCLVKPDCCASIVDANRNCYRAQCFATSRALAEALDLGAYDVTFQSRLGKTPWIKPYTDEHLVQLAEEGVKRVAVLCPAFTADCLETIEEIGIRAVEDFKAAGGEDLRLVPSLNSEDRWADAICEIVGESVQLPAAP